MVCRRFVCPIPESLLGVFIGCLFAVALRDVYAETLRRGNYETLVILVLYWQGNALSVPAP